MARPIWKGAISFGLVTVPVGLYSATERKETLSFHLLHRKDGARIEMKRFCSEEDIEVPWSEVEKGYEYEKGQYVVVTDEEFERARTPATQTFDIRTFVDAEQVADLYFDQPYYLAPQGRAGAKAYALLRDALGDAGKIGVGTIVLRQREHLAALEPAGDVLVLTTMRFAHELQSPKELDVPDRGKGWSEKEMKLARQLIDTLAGAWDPTAFTDTYTDVLKDVIQQKVEGKEVHAPRPARRPKVVSLLKALEASLERPEKKAEARARHAVRRRRHKKAA